MSFNRIGALLVIAAIFGGANMLHAQTPPQPEGSDVGAVPNIPPPDFYKPDMTISDVEALSDEQKIEYQEWLQRTIYTANRDTSTQFGPVTQSIFYGEQTFVPQPDGSVDITIQVKPEREAILEARYIVTVYNADPLAEQSLLDSMVVKLPETLKPEVWNNVTVKYQPPAILSSYARGVDVRLELVTKFGANLIPPSSFGTLELLPQETTSSILLSECTVEVSVGEEATSYPINLGIDVLADENLTLVCTASVVQSPTDSDAISAYSVEEAFLRSVGSGDPIDQFKAQEPLIISSTGIEESQRKQEVRIPILRTNNTVPQAYDAVVYLLDDGGNIISNQVIVHYVLAGRSGSVLGIYPDKTTYSSGDTARVRITVTGNTGAFPGARNEAVPSEGLELSMSMTDAATGDECGNVSAVPVTLDSLHISVEIPIKRDCTQPQYTARLTDAVGELIAYTESVSVTDSASGTPSAPSVAALVFVALTLLCVGVGIAVVIHKKRIPPQSIALFVFAWSMLFPVAQAFAANAIGSFDGVTVATCKVSGWAYDPDSPSTSIRVDVYRDNSAFAGGTLVTSCNTNTPRLDVNTAYSITGNHGFECVLPASYANTGAHNLYIHAIDTTNTPNNVISLSPQSLTCTAPADGVCGSATTISHTVAPSTNLCAVGAPSVVSGTGPWTWTCAGVAGGNPTSCRAKLPPVANMSGNLQGFFDGYSVGCRVGGWVIDLDSQNTQVKVGLHIVTSAGSVPVASCNTTISRTDVTNTYKYTTARTTLGFDCPMPTNAIANQPIKAYAQDVNNVNNWYEIPLAGGPVTTDTTRCNPDSSVTVGNYTCIDGVFNATTGGQTYDRAGRYCADVVSPTYTDSTTNINTYLTNMTCGNADYLRGRPSFSIVTAPYSSCTGPDFCRLYNTQITNTNVLRSSVLLDNTLSGSNNTVLFWNSTVANELSAGGAVIDYTMGAPTATGNYYLESNFVGIAGVTTGFVPLTKLYAPFTVTTPAAATYTLTVNSSGAAGVAITANSATYNGTTNYTRSGITSGTSITLTAPATAGGNNFSAWSGCDSTNAVSRTCTVSMTSSKTVTVDYPGAAAGNILEACVGSTQVAVGGSPGLNRTLSQGQVELLKVFYDATPDCAGTDVSGTAVTGSNMPYDVLSVPVGTPAPVTANSVGTVGNEHVDIVYGGQSTMIDYDVTGGVAYTLTVSRHGSGVGAVASSPAGITCPFDCNQSYNSGAVVTLTATPAAASTFDGWSGGICVGTGTCTVTMSAARNVTATFTAASDLIPQ